MDIASLPELRSDYPLAPDRIAAYQRDGHIQLPAVASPEEVAAYRPILMEAVMRHRKETRPLADRDTYHRAFLQIGNLWELDGAIRRFVMARRFARIAAGLMGVEGVRLYHDQALYKEPGGGHTPWHQDQYYWPLDTPHTITLWMPLVDVSPDMGPMTFVSGSHRGGPLANLQISDASDEFYRELIAERQYTLECRPIRAGDATFHSGWTLHGAGPNNTQSMREVMTIIYYADGTRIGEPFTPNQPLDLARWLPGLKPGDLAATDLNPLLYTREG